MKFSWKIFIVSFLIIIISFGTGGFVLVNSVFTSSLNTKIESVCQSNAYATASFYSMNVNVQASGYNSGFIDYTIKNFTKQLSSSSDDTKVDIGDKSIVTVFDDGGFAEEIKQNERNYRIKNDKGRKYLQVVSLVNILNKDYYIQSLADITSVYEDRDSYFRTYQIILMCVALSASFLLLIFSRLITRPLEKLTDTANEIAGGDFEKRAESSSTKEIYELSNSFNTMTDFVEGYIEELSEEVRRRDDFVSAFTHELKTPLTSVIGYADMMRSYELDADKRRSCADNIYKEGKRLESLSANLLELLVLKHTDVEMSEINTGVIESDIQNAVLFLLEKYNVMLEIELEQATIIAEPALLKTLIYNLIDNACKASEQGGKVIVWGACQGDRYEICVGDYGRGIPKEELAKIIEPFYMVDKSRARSMGGAGIGLALCNEIARLHGSALDIKSEVGVGTAISFDVPIAVLKEGECVETS